MDSDFGSMISLQIASLLGGLISGTVLTVIFQPYVFELVPTEGYGPIISWIVAGGLGYIAGGVVASIIGLLGFYVIFRNI